MSEKALIPSRIERTILRLRGQNVILDADLAALYGVKTGALVRAVKRNSERFPDDFMFQLSREESGRGGRRFLPYAFTEQGVAMLSSILRSPNAAAVNVEIMRAFVELRRVLGSHAELARKLDALEQRYDARFKAVFRAIRELMAPSKAVRRQIGFRHQ